MLRQRRFFPRVAADKINRDSGIADLFRRRFTEVPDIVPHAHRTKDVAGFPDTRSAVLIERLVEGGLGMGRIDGEVVFIPLTAPQDLVVPKNLRRTRGVFFAEPGAILEPSPDRRDPSCPLFGACGGCQLMHLSYPRQVEIKAGILAETLSRLGKVQLEGEFPANQSPMEFTWRHRARLQVHGGRLGFFRRASHSLVSWDRCPVLTEGINHLVARLTASGSRRMSANSVESLEVAQSPVDGAVSLYWQRKGGFKGRGWQGFLGWMEDLGRESAHELAGQAWLLPSGGVARRGKSLSLDEGRSCASPGTFFQVNPMVNRILVQRVLAHLQAEGARSLVDLYCGNGNFALAAAAMGLSVLGVEESLQAVVDARSSAAGSAEFLNRPVEAYVCGTPKLEADALLVDPPRTGLPRIVREAAERWGVPLMFYVSCNAASLARDLSYLLREVYLLRSVEFFDMFPQSSHGETLAVLERRG